MWAYEVPTRAQIRPLVGSARAVDVIVVYNFHTLLTQSRLHVFALQSSTQRSIAELFPAANWLEREARELHGTEFTYKKDVRNLLLQYGDTSAPFRKAFPAIGLRELYYDPAYDGVLQQDLTTQV
jgi:NADH:ubiquinone oxidoreductase subunit C